MAEQMMHGWLILDKPAGITSAKAVSVVKKRLKPQKIGHGGTLDPMATGILPLALGEATKAFQYVAMQEKTYRFTVQWGAATSTDDAEGEVMATSDKRPTCTEIEEILPQFTGTIMQAPPSVSAIKVDGKRAYKRARAGEAVAIPPRPVEVMELRLHESSNHRGIESSVFTVRCGKGTYVRSLARDMGEALGCHGHIMALRRCSVGKFHENQAISLDDLEKMDYEAALAALYPIEQVLDDIPAVSLEEQQANRLAQGQTASPVQASVTFRNEPLLRCHRLKDWKLIGLATPVGSQVKPVRIFNV